MRFGAEKRRAEKRSSKTQKWTATCPQLSLGVQVCYEQTLNKQRRKWTLQNHPLDNHFSHGAFSTPLARSDKWDFISAQTLRALLGKTLNGHHHMVAGKWPKTINKKHPDCFRTFSPIFARSRPFLHFLSLVLAPFGVSVSDRFFF